MNLNSPNLSYGTTHDRSTRLCPICKKAGHGALTCRHRSNFSYLINRMICRHPLLTCLQSLLHDLNDEATCYTEASKRPHWRAAMLDEFNALLKERTWSLVPASQAKKIVGCQNRIGCQSVFKVKRKADGTIERHKARLLAKGYTIKKMALTLMKL